ncbi:hypothetical protein [Mariniblastus fucicola]|uniref:Flagellar assembly protein H n=1 Tax=Mariniblastus fucicola TaxID=980251 RepID=A0A5B9PE06_9BACT|nr:hypothetical protein [Mariniblastus fucicola]QEG23370.1 hypothetical protein MFFC18_32680 [Mariniblastus fucicola]
MTNFSVQFTAPVQSVQVVGKGCRVGKPVETAQAIEEAVRKEPEPVAVTTISTEAVESALGEVVNQLKAQQSELHEFAARYAVEILRVFLISSDEVIEQRLRDNVLRMLDQPGPLEVLKVSVHSSCHSSMQKWILESDIPTRFNCTPEVLVDDQLSPGDCSVDVGQNLRLASLEQQLQLVESRLMQTVRAKREEGLS